MAEILDKVFRRSSREVGAGSQVRSASTNLSDEVKGVRGNVRSFQPDLSDAELVVLWQSRGYRDDRPFQELFRRHQNLVWRICYSYIRHSQDAEDLTAKVFYRALSHIEKYVDRGVPFQAWLYRIAHNLVAISSNRPSEPCGLVS